MNSFKLNYLSTKIDYYKHEVEYFKSKPDLTELDKQQLNASQEMLDLFLEIEAQVVAWNSVKDYIFFPNSDSVIIDACFSTRGKTSTEYTNICRALELENK